MTKSFSPLWAAFPSGSGVSAKRRLRLYSARGGMVCIIRAISVGMRARCGGDPAQQRAKLPGGMAGGGWAIVLGEEGGQVPVFGVRRQAPVRQRGSVSP